MGEPDIVVALFGHGRYDYLRQTIASLESSIDQDRIVAKYIFDDSTDRGYAERLSTEYPTWRVIGGSKRVGFGGNIRRAWGTLPSLAELGARYVFHVEEDFTFNAPIPLGCMTYVLDTNPHVVQVALLRQPVNHEERQAGGLLQLHPDRFTDVDDSNCEWVEHRAFFTTNPSLYRLSLCDAGWPDVEHSEGIFTHQLLAADENARFAFHGTTTDAPMVHHIGDDRADGEGY